MTKLKIPLPRTNPFRWLFKQNIQFALAFFIPFGILTLAYICFGVYPVGNRSVLSLDLNGQYVYYFDYMYDVLAGRESLFYSWSRSLSGEFMGIIGYYLASPFNFLVWIFPRAHITEGLLLMLVTKAGVIGACMSVYLYRGRGLSKSTSVIFSMLYALCSYTIVQTMNPMWLDGVMALPLVVYGIESLVRYGRFRMLCISLVYSFVTCFYIGYMIGIFAALYFLYYFFASDSFGRLEVGAVFARIGLFFISAVTSLMCSAFMLLPVYSSLSLGKFEFSDPDYSIRSNFNLMSLLGKLLPNSYDTVRMEGLPFLYCGIITVILLVCFFAGGKNPSGKKLKPINVRKRIACASLILILTVCMYITPVDMMWHGGQMPNWLPYRYSFIISFLFAGWAAEAFERLSGYSKKLIGGASFAFFAVMIYLESTDTFMPSLGKDGREVLDGISVILPASLILLITAAMLVQWRDKLIKKRSVTITLGILVACELFYNTFSGVMKQHIDIVYSTRDSYVSVIEPVREVVSEITERELTADPNAVFRIEKNFFRTVNDPLALNMYGLSHSSSTLNERPISLLGSLGLTSRSHYTRYSGATPVIDDLFGIKYILSSSGNDTASITSKDDITVEENTDAMPIAYLTDTGLAGFSLSAGGSDDLNVFRLQNRILSQMLGEEYRDYFITISEDFIELETENVKYGKASGGHTSYKVEAEGKNSQLKYSLTAERDGEIFLWMPTDYERKLNLWVNKTVNDESEGEVKTDLWKGNLFETDNYCVKSLGDFSEGEKFSVTLTLTKDDLYFKDIFFAYMDKELYEEAIGRLHEINSDTRVEKLSPTHLRISASSGTERLLFTTIPAEPGWTLTVDGQKTDYIELLPEKTGGEGALIGVIIPSGQHIIEMKFNVNYYPIALYATGGGILLLILLFALSYRLNKIRRSMSSDDDEYDIVDDDISLLNYSGYVNGVNLEFTRSESFRSSDEITSEPEYTESASTDNNLSDDTISEDFTTVNAAEEEYSEPSFTKSGSVEETENDENTENNENDYSLSEDISDDTNDPDNSYNSDGGLFPEDFPDGNFSEDSVLSTEIVYDDISENSTDETPSEYVPNNDLSEYDFTSYSSENEQSSDFSSPVTELPAYETSDIPDMLLPMEETADIGNENENDNDIDGKDEDFSGLTAAETDYDKESVDKNISLILNELNEINQVDDEYFENGSEFGAEISAPPQIETENLYAGSADDLFPDEEIENLESD